MQVRALRLPLPFLPPPFIGCEFTRRAEVTAGQRAREDGEVSVSGPQRVELEADGLQRLSLRVVEVA